MFIYSYNQEILSTLFLAEAGHHSGLGFSNIISVWFKDHGDTAVAQRNFFSKRKKRGRDTHSSSGTSTAVNNSITVVPVPQASKHPGAGGRSPRKQQGKRKGRPAGRRNPPPRPPITAVAVPAFPAQNPGIPPPIRMDDGFFLLVGSAPGFAETRTPSNPTTVCLPRFLGKPANDRHQPLWAGCQNRGRFWRC